MDKKVKYFDSETVAFGKYEDKLSCQKFVHLPSVVINAHLIGVSSLTELIQVVMKLDFYELIKIPDSDRS